MIFTRKLLWEQRNLLSERNVKGMNDMAYLDELTDRYPSLEPVKESIRESYEILKECFSSGHKLLVAGKRGGLGAYCGRADEGLCKTPPGS